MRRRDNVRRNRRARKVVGIEDEEIVKPVMIVGQTGTGTLLLPNALSREADKGSLRNRECMFPCPAPEKATYFTDPRIAKEDHLVE